MIILLSITAVLISVFIAGRIKRSTQFGNDVKILFISSKPLSGQSFSYSQLIDLPEAVQRYFKQALKEGQPYISYARITHDGLFKSGSGNDWVDIKGEQYATTGRPGFIWKGTTSLFTASDSYILDKGRLVVTLFGLLRIAGGTGAP